MEVNCQAWHERVRIIATDGWLAEYNGQECDAIFYDGESGTRGMLLPGAGVIARNRLKTAIESATAGGDGS